jgi:tricorn protease
MLMRSVRASLMHPPARQARDLVVFVAADDVWLAPLAGGQAWRFTTDEAQAATPRLTPDGTQLAWVSAKHGSPEIYVAGLADGTSTLLTYGCLSRMRW